MHPGDMVGGGVDDGPSETAEDIGRRLLKEAQLHYFGESLTNVTYPSRISAQRVRSFIQRQANCMASLLEQIRVARANVTDEGIEDSPASGGDKP